MTTLYTLYDVSGVAGMSERYLKPKRSGKCLVFQDKLFGNGLKRG